MSVAELRGIRFNESQSPEDGSGGNFLNIMQAKCTDNGQQSYPKPLENQSERCYMLFWLVSRIISILYLTCQDSFFNLIYLNSLQKLMEA
jgi:hypothetical protein